MNKNLFSISNNKNLNNEIYNSFVENNRIKEIVKSDIEKIDVFLLYMFSEENYIKAIYDENGLPSNLENDETCITEFMNRNENILMFEFEEVEITNPFYDESSTSIVNPISHYGNEFLESDFIYLLKDIVESRKNELA